MIGKMDYSKYGDFGYNIFGPFLYGFTKWLRERILLNGDAKIFFFSRDGYIMQKAYMLFEGKKALGLKEEYVYFSRNSLRRCLLWKTNSYEESLKYLSKERFTEFAELASYYGLEQDELMPLLDNVGLKWNDNLSFNGLADNKSVKKIYDHFEDYIKQQSYAQYLTVVTYLKQIEMSGNCAIVDIGWHGTMQFYLEQLIELSGIEARINGYYVGHHSYVPVKGKAEGFVYNQDNLKYKNQIRCFFGVGEKFFQSMDGSTDHYKALNGKIVPELKPYEYSGDQTIKTCISILHKGALNYVKESILSGVSFAKNEDYFMPLLKFGKSPSYEQTQMFKFFYNTDGGKIYYIPQKSLSSYKPNEFFWALISSPWKTGFMKASFRFPFPYYWIYSLIKR